ncbi:hypothetical protein GCM10017673_04370 [Streptosporangium violaceochromogenes]|nr:hypothetical protein GCM10017673_04370 [Streptosporangium violaceochromogenes]
MWDGPARSEAAHLERSRSGWVVLYGVGTRRFYAMAARPAPEPVMVEAATAEDLAERMGEAETTLLLRATTPTAPGDPGVSGRPRRPGSRRRAVRAAGSRPTDRKETPRNPRRASDLRRDGLHLPQGPPPDPGRPHPTPGTAEGGG